MVRLPRRYRDRREGPKIYMSGTRANTSESPMGSEPLVVGRHQFWTWLARGFLGHQGSPKPHDHQILCCLVLAVRE